MILVVKWYLMPQCKFLLHLTIITKRKKRGLKFT